MLNYDSIKELLIGMNRGDFDQKDLVIYVDNDGCFFGLKGILGDDEDGEPVFAEIEVPSEGYMDVEILYSILFPLADVGWV